MSNKFQFGSWTLDEVEEAIQDLVRKGLVVDSGLRRWCEETGRYEIVWKLAKCADEEQMKAHDNKVTPLMGPTKRIRPRKARTYSLAAERTRRHRQRLRDGFTHVAIDLRRSEVDGLVRLGFLSAETRNDMNAIRTALYEYFESTLEPTS